MDVVLADPNHIIVEELKLALLLPCKVGNSSIKNAIARHLGLPTESIHRSGLFEYISKENIAALSDEWLKVAFVRNPYDRFHSAWRDKIRDKSRYHIINRASMPTLDEMAEMLPIANQHWRRLTDEICVSGKVVADLVIKTDDMPSAWELFRKRVEQHCGEILPDITHETRTEDKGERVSKTHIHLVRNYYAEDFIRFGYKQ